MMVDGPLYPVTAPGIDFNAQFAKMAAAGVQSVRAVFDWSFAQPYRQWSDVPAADLDQFADERGIPTRFSEMDEIVAAAASQGMSVLPVILYTPGWAAGPHPNQDFAIPKGTQPYANFVAALVDRYGPGGTFWLTHSPAVPIRMWQIWNEPNISVFWWKHPYQRSYVKLLHAAHDAIKHRDPGAKVVLAGLPNFSWIQLGKLYKVRGVSKWFDVAAVHPYTKTPTGVITILQKARQVMDQNGDRNKQIVADEISWPSSRGKTDHNVGFDFATTERGQARKLAKMLPMLGANRKSLNLLGFYYYTWATVENPNGLAFDYSGLEKYDPTTGVFTAKPALSAFTNAALTLER
jgi:arabinogalactan endo-1,4-beta-galactosidase